MGLRAGLEGQLPIGDLQLAIWVNPDVRNIAVAAGETRLRAGRFTAEIHLDRTNPPG